MTSGSVSTVMMSVASDWSHGRLESIKGGSTLAVVIPALNEEGTIGQVVSAIAAELGELVDELVVMDSLSSDRTAAVATDAGARVHSVADVRPDLGVHPGKGEALWKSQFVTSADVVAFVDADLTEWGTHFVRGVVGPLLADPQVVLCRGFYDRVLDIDGDVTLQGGRVTELVARPWLALFRPELGSMVQPLAGEWAIRRDALQQLHVPIGYGVEFSTLLDVCDEWGGRQHRSGGPGASRPSAPEHPRPVGDGCRDSRDCRAPPSAAGGPRCHRFLQRRCPTRPPVGAPAVELPSAASYRASARQHICRCC